MGGRVIYLCGSGQAQVAGSSEQGEKHGEFLDLVRTISFSARVSSNACRQADLRYTKTFILNPFRSYVQRTAFDFTRRPRTFYQIQLNEHGVSVAGIC